MRSEAAHFYPPLDSPDRARKKTLLNEMKTHAFELNNEILLIDIGKIKELKNAIRTVFASKVDEVLTKKRKTKCMKTGMDVDVKEEVQKKSLQIVFEST